MLQNLFIDRLSFWIGFFSGILFAWFIVNLRRVLPRLIRFIKERIRLAKENLEAGTEIRFRRDVLRHVQKQHLAAPLFSLEEVIIQPFLQVPPIQAHVMSEMVSHDLIQQSMPYLPDWPEFRANFSGPVFTLAEALQKDANILLIGQPGSGKTTALAHLAALIAQKRPETGVISSLLPIPVHASDLNLHKEELSDPLAAILEGLSTYVSPMTMSGLLNFLRPVMRNGECLVMIDGLDELPPEDIDITTKFLDLLLNTYPKIRIVAAAAPDYYGKLTTLELYPVSMAVWTNQQMAAFIHQWGELWERFIKVEGIDQVDAYLLENWLSGGDSFTTPLEKTLNVWAAFAGDVLGPDPRDSIEAHLRRMAVNSPRTLPVMEIIAASAVKELKSVFTIREAEKWIQESGITDRHSPTENLPEDEVSDEEVPDSTETQQDDESKKADNKGGLRGALISERLLSESINTGLIIEKKNGRLSFYHPVIAAFLAAGGLIRDGGIDSLLEQPEWAGKNLTLQLLSSKIDLNQHALPLLNENHDPILHNQNAAWRCLRYSSKSDRWRSTVLKKLASIVQDPSNATGIRLRAISALASTRDPGVNTFFRQILSHPEPSVRKAGALGCGLVKDHKATAELSILIDDLSSEVGWAAIQGLNAIGTTAAIDEIKNALFTGSDEMRRAAAEALSTHEEAGHSILEHGSQMDDMLVRKAVVYGLARVNKLWAREILEAMQLEDGQWLVRNAASEALEALSEPDLHIPQPMPILSEAPWLIVFAGKMGIGVAPGKPAFNLVLQALDKGDPLEQLAALDYLKIHASPDAVPGIYEILFGCEGRLEEAAFDTLWSMSSSGIDLPSPVRFGMGD
jgi:HEAT repeat protein/energy-coupling factor transporter ATP-binding protein EcfA2